MFYYWPQRKAKVMFLLVSVILLTGGSASVHAGIPPPPPGKHAPPRVCLSACWDTTPGKHAPPPGKHAPPGKQAPPRSWHPSPPRHMVNEQPVRILPECILVSIKFSLPSLWKTSKFEQGTQTINGWNHGAQHEEDWLGENPKDSLRRNQRFYWAERPMVQDSPVLPDYEQYHRCLSQ